MIPNAFIGWPHPPTDGELAEALGPARPLWDRAVEGIAGELGLADREWKCSGRAYGWSLRLKRGKRNIVHLSPCRECFRVAIILGDRAVSAARSSGLGAAAMRLIDEAPRYPEGTGIRIEVTGPEDLPLIEKLARIKLEN